MGGFCQKALIYVIGLSIGTLSVGFGLGFYAAAYSSVVEEFILDTSMKKSVYNAIAPICAIFGGPIVNFAIQRYGRKYPTMISSLVVIIGWILIIVTKKSYKELAYVGRAINGLGLGAVSTVNPVYIAELSPTEVRGAYGVMSQLFCSIGALFIYFLGIWLKWREIAGIAIVFPAITIVCLFFIPESPAFERMDTSVKKKQVNIFQKKYFKALFISFLIVVFQQFSGINALLTNLTVIFENSNVSLNPAVSSVIVTAAQVITTACSTPLVEFLGRKLTWMISSIGQALFLLICWGNQKWDWNNVLPVVMLFLDVFFFGIGLGPLPWFVVPELFPDEVRGLAMGIIQAVNWFLCALMVFIFPTMQESMTLAWTYFFYGIIMVISFLYGMLLLPETRNKKMGANIESDVEDVNDDSKSSKYDSSSNSSKSKSSKSSSSKSKSSSASSSKDEV
ncbi:Sugar transporter ERD6-like 6 [Tritrichomonas foetus]|uniref:Sugar transporter ERD6-like 6 n=1 Tax=Tritrichomonas foetus TaxID=1144522 RepID=A0A1J4JIJ7_9EUKA|nr:Sugar transporter ERD6-like 6 [Tritrichomonas foetus]|eukprot:OHS99016.1 Sugar transporter ERD6-like 6 [Tritrichomonas foetus]